MFGRRIIERYIFREMLGPFFLSLAVANFVLLLAKVMELTDLVVTRGVGMGVVGRLLLYALPYFFVFAVPMATLLMVTEMTGGYHLLVAAALAVSVSYIVEVLLTSKLKYKSLYEAQVPGRADSPAHHGDYLKAALHILKHHNITLSADGDHVDLERLLDTGIPIDLADDKQLRLGRLPSKSSLVEKRVRDIVSLLPPELADEVRVSAIFRNGHTLIPYGDLRFKSCDRVLFIASPQAWEHLSKYFQFDHEFMETSNDQTERATPSATS